MSYIDRLKEHLSEIDPAEAPPKPPEPGFRGLSGASQGHISAAQRVKAWRASIARLTLETPLHGLGLPRWRQWLGDAQWLLDHFADRAAREGWDTLDLFGHVPGREEMGGLVCQLRGARSLVMSDRSARWRSIAGVPRTFGRGGLAGCEGLAPMWEGDNAES